jgi:diguanylate cyclase (GGDEF)-like protein
MIALLVLRWVTRSVARRVAVYAAAIAAVAATVVGGIVVAVVMGDQPEAARREMLLVAVVGGASTVACVAAATVFVVNRLLRAPLLQLTDALRAAEQGRWLKTVESGRVDEIGELGRSFDRVSAKVTDLSVAVIDSDRELEWTRRELKLKEALALLFELSQTINAETDLEAILAAVPSRIGNALGFEQMAVLLADEASGDFVVRAAHGIAGDAIGVRFSKDDPISGTVARTGEALVIPDTARDARYSHFQGRHRIDGAFASVPMKVQGRLVGLFNVLRPGAPISDGDLRLLSSLASYAGLAIAHASMNEKLREMAVTDELTGLCNRRALMKRVAHEVERSRAGGGPLAALMLDLDHFKRVNDDLGHQVGDGVLAKVAAGLRAEIPPSGTLARYGGEEFLVLLPDTSRAQATAVAEKLRRAVAAADRPQPLTLSVGLAVFPDDAAGDSALLGAADRALLEAKRTGRDRVVAA